MNLFNAIFRRERNVPTAPRKRPARSFAMSLGSLERRALLATIGPVALPSTTMATAVVTLTSVTQSGPGQSLIQPPVPLVPFTTPTQGMAIIGGIGHGPGIGGSGGGVWTPGGGDGPDGPNSGEGTGEGPAGPTQGTGHDHSANFVSLAEAAIPINGALAPEFVLADAGISKVFVRADYGQQLTVLGPSQGIDKPRAVALDDINGDDLPDLIVANSGGDNILIFPGLPGGQFGPEVNGGKGFTVGQDPVSVTIGDVNSDGTSDLVVANKGSDSVTILQGESSAAGWTASSESTIAIGDPSNKTEPVKTALIERQPRRPSRPLRLQQRVEQRLPLQE